MYHTVPHSSLYWRIYKIHHIGEKYVKCKMIFYYKSSKEECSWLRCKNYKVIRNIYESWVKYDLTERDS